MCDDYFTRRSALGKPPLKHQLVAYTMAENVIGVYKYTNVCIRQQYRRHYDNVARGHNDAARVRRRVADNTTVTNTSADVATIVPSHLLQHLLKTKEREKR